uniref:Uncharacterized protein n=1 Tax=Oryza sativa subsp. japonica TaxID=39947 RepID=Q6Z3X1_ORYSJ|nr:hypothetical protein [Oryza sativa Japonica Group]
MVLFGAPEWLAPSSNGTAPASLAPTSCHRGVREPTWQEEGASHAGAAPGRRAPAWLAPPPHSYFSVWSCNGSRYNQLQKKFKLELPLS